MPDPDVTKQPAPGSLARKEPSDAQFVTEPLDKMAPMMHRMLAAWFVAIGVLSVYLLVTKWPDNVMAVRVESKLDSLSRQIQELRAGTQAVDTVDAGEPKSAAGEEMKKPRIGSDEKFFLIAIFGGMLGGAAHGLSSLMNFRGNRRLFRSWSLWYFGLPILGGMMSIIFFMVLQAGLIANSALSQTVNPYGVAALSALVGLFTDEATRKLAEVFKTLFATKEKDNREGKLKPETRSSEEKTKEE